MVKLHIKTSKIGATGTSDNVRKGRTYVLLGILFFQNSGGAGVRIPLSGRMPPLSSIPPCVGCRFWPLWAVGGFSLVRHNGTHVLYTVLCTV